jgi:hypothetical protein
MTDGRIKALTLLHDRLGSMPAAERRAAMGNVRRAEALADQIRELIPRAARRLRGLRTGE